MLHFLTKATRSIYIGFNELYAKEWLEGMEGKEGLSEQRKERESKLERTHEAFPRLCIPLYTATAHKHPTTFKWTVYIVNTTNSRVREELADVDGEVVGGTMT